MYYSNMLLWPVYFENTLSCGIDYFPMIRVPDSVEQKWFFLTLKSSNVYYRR